MELKAEAISKDFVFVAGEVLSPGKYLFAAHNAASIEMDIYEAHLLLLDEGSWSDLAVFHWQVVDMVAQFHDPFLALLLGRDGQIGVLASGEKQEQKLDEKRAVGPMRGAVCIDSTVYTFGMQRDVYKQLNRTTWERFNKGMQTSPAVSGGSGVSATIMQRIKDRGGINAIVGHSAEDLHAFGMRGEIWQLRGGAWVRADSPTNLTLTDAALQEDGRVFVCGQMGTIIQGFQDEWRVVEYDGPKNLDFSAVVVFQGRPYLADGHSLRVLDNGALQLVDFRVDAVVPCSSLKVFDGFLLSIAGQELFVTADGSHWTDLLSHS